MIKEDTGIEMEENASKFEYKKSLKKQDKNILNKLIRVERYINRPLAALVVKAVFNTRITPNGLTYISFFTGLIGAFFISMGEYKYLVTGGILVQLASIIDCADGQLARSKNMCSQYGQFLDLFLDRVTDFALHAALAVGASKAFNDPNLLILGLLGAGLYQLQTTLFYLTNTYKKITKTGETGEARALMLLLIMVFCCFNRIDIGLYLLLAETTIVVLLRIIYFIRLGKKKG